MKLTTTLFTIFLAFNLSAQIVSFTEEIPLRTEIGYEIIGELKGRTLLFKNRPNDPEIQAFNEKMRELWTKKIKLDKRNPNIHCCLLCQVYWDFFYRV